MMEEEINFPRGGSGRKQQSSDSTSDRKLIEKKKSRKRADSNDFLFGKAGDETSASKKTKKRKKSTEKSAAESAESTSSAISSLPLGGGAVQAPINSAKQKKPAFIESISFQKLTKGMKLLGVVREVAEEYAVVSLPSMLTGFIRPNTNSSTRLDHVLSVGMVLPVVILKATSETINEKSFGSKSKPVVKRRIELSVSPSAVNNGLTADMLYEGMSVRGRIRSVEDHGCLVDLSINGIRGNSCFLKYDNIEGEYEVIDTKDDEMQSDDNDKFLLNSGRIYDFTIMSLPKMDSGKLDIIQMKLQTAQTRSKTMADTVACKKAKHTIRSLCPGMLLPVSVEHHAGNGICVTFMGHVYRGSIDSNNLGGFLPEDYDKYVDKKQGTSNEMWWKSVFVGRLKSVNARLIAVDPATKIMRLSLLPHILSLTAPELGNTRIGDIVENARVIRLDQGVGALLAFPVTEDNQVNKKENDLYQAASKISCAYVHISKAFDNKSRTPEALFAKKFSMNNVIPKLRILSKNNWMDNIASCATAEDIVSAAVLTHRDLQPGRIYKALPVLANLDNGGVLVQLGNDVKGLIPEMHLFDKSMSSDSGTSSYRNKIRSTKYKVGNKIDVRCLLISPAERKCMLTAKKSLLSSDMQNPITDYSEIEKGRIATGYVSGVSKLGIAITFYNNVFGRVSARKLAEDMGVEDPTSDYNVGDVVKAKVRRCFKKNNDELRDSYILDLTLNLLSESNETTDIDTNTTQLANLMKPGMILKAKSMKIVELVPSKVRDSDSAFFPGHALVTVKCKHLINDDCENIKGGSLNFKLPYDHILDSHLDNENQSANSMDALASKVFTIGKKIAQEAVILSTTNRNGSLSLIVSLKPDLVATAKENALKTKNNSTDAIMPTPTTALFMGAYVRGYCVRLHPNYGAFIRFLGGLTAIIPKLKGGLNVGLYDTVLCKIIAMDVMNGKAPKILLKQVNASKKSKIQKGKEISANRIVDFVKPGDIVGDVKIDDINFARATVTILDEKFADSNVKARIHMTMANSLAEDDLKMPLTRMVKDDLEDSGKSEKITKFHPFCSWEVGKVKTGVICVAIDVRDGITYLELANRNVESKRLFFEEPRQLSVGTKVSGVITAIAKQNKGLWTQICPGITGFVPGLELSDNVEILNNLSGYFKVGGRVDCCVVRDTKQKGQFKEGVRLSILAMARSNEKTRKPLRGDSMVGRVNRFITQQRAPSLMIELSGGYLGRCDITELEENDDWENMPLGRLNTKESGDKSQDDAIEDEDEVDNAKGSDPYLVGEFRHGVYVQCRCLGATGTAKGTVEVSLRQSRIDGDLDDDDVPEQTDIVHAYVVQTTKKGCFLRLSRFVEGRVILKELSDSFLPDPTTTFPPGRLIVGKVKEVKKAGKKSKKTIAVDLDMRESVLLEDQNKLTFDDIKEGEKHRGVVTRIESYGVFVRLDNSAVSGLVHLSECSDDYVKNLASMFNPGDLVKVLILRVETDDRRIGLSMKPSHFEDDEESDDDSDTDSSSDMEDGDMSMAEVEATGLDIDSDDEDFVAKLAKQVGNDDKKSDEDSSDSDDDESDDDDDDDDDDESQSSDSSGVDKPRVMDTDVGFDWGTKETNATQNADNDSSDESDSESDDDKENDTKKGHKSRKKALAKREEEKAISMMEQRIADGTADENPETTADFERLIASDPNSSENWIKFMAYHLSLADIESARTVADRAFERIEFREEGEKLNVWTALITLENKYGAPSSLSAVITRASQHNNPKQVYLRVCEMMERDVDLSHGDVVAIEKADEMFTTMCKKFRSKKAVWIAHFKYLLKNGRHDEAHKLWKRSIMSLPSHKHIETMKKFAQLEYEFGSAERARTIFDSLLTNYPKKLDLVRVYVDKEVKHGDLNAARRILQGVVNPKSHGQKKVKFSDHQMKKLFRRWFEIEELHGTEESQLRVKITAKEYVERSMK